MNSETVSAASLAAALNGREYNNEMTAAEIEQAKTAGLVIVFGASDDLMELRGAIDDEVDCYDGGVAYLTNVGLLQNDCDNDECPHFKKMRDAATLIKAFWGRDGYSWTYEIAIPHQTFEVMDEGRKYCRGIVFALADVPN